jgi:cytochrome c oxidase subunit 2
MRTMCTGRRRHHLACAALAALVLASCDGAQSALAPAGREAERIAALFWWMAGGAAVVWAALVALGVYAVRARLDPGHHRWAAMWIIGGGAVVPSVVLAVLLAFGLDLLPELLAPAPAGSLRVSVAGERWWWRVRYETPQGPVELANEVRLPVGEPVEFHLESGNVIHSFWIPSLGGKVDMIPGRRTRLTLRPAVTGRFRGQCAEYCGIGHALMGFPVVVMEKGEFERWLQAQAQPARPAAGAAARGQEAFQAHGCGACHAVRGTAARGVIGPDLTHVGGRLSLGAGLLPNGRGALVGWLADPEHQKPGVLMPSYGMLPPEELHALAVYLEGLE